MNSSFYELLILWTMRRQGNTKKNFLVKSNYVACGYPLECSRWRIWKGTSHDFKVCQLSTGNWPYQDVYFIKVWILRSHVNMAKKSHKTSRCVTYSKYRKLCSRLCISTYFNKIRSFWAFELLSFKLTHELNILSFLAFGFFLFSAF